MGCKHGKQAPQFLIAKMYFDSELYLEVVTHHLQTNRGYGTELTVYRCDSTTAPLSLIFCGYVVTTALGSELCFNSPLPNAPRKLHFSFVVLFFSLSPLTAVEIQKNTNRLCLCIKESKQVKKQHCYSPESMLVSLQAPLPEVYSGGSLRSLHYPPSQPRDPAGRLQ